MIYKIAYIEKLPNGQWRVLSEKGKNLGTYDSYQAAKKRLAQVEMFKAMKNRKKALSNIANHLKIAQEVTFSSTMRKLRKETPGKVESFMKHFKEAFERAEADGLENSENYALLEALQKTI